MKKAKLRFKRWEKEFYRNEAKKKKNLICKRNFHINASVLQSLLFSFIFSSVESIDKKAIGSALK